MCRPYRAHAFWVCLHPGLHPGLTVPAPLQGAVLTAKGLLSGVKRISFRRQKDFFRAAKGLLWHGERTPFARDEQPRVFYNPMKEGRGRSSPVRAQHIEPRVSTLGCADAFPPSKPCKGDTRLAATRRRTPARRTGTSRNDGFRQPTAQRFCNEIFAVRVFCTIFA